MARQPREVKGYEAERWRAQQETIMRSMNRRIGRVVPDDVDTLPDRTDSQYDPRKW